jgi:uncharacterized membrane-anchored protein YhcB (DUF1043 family)
MDGRDWSLIGAGVLIGIPIGMLLLWLLQQRTPAQAPQTPQTLQPPQQVYNEERWTWIDYRGRRREIVVKREAKAVV